MAQDDGSITPQMTSDTILIRGIRHIDTDIKVAKDWLVAHPWGTAEQHLDGLEDQRIGFRILSKHLAIIGYIVQYPEHYPAKQS